MLESIVCVKIPNVVASFSYPLVMRQAIAFAKEHVPHYVGMESIAREDGQIIATVRVRALVEAGAPSKDYKVI
jgi:hypothetical protein